MLSGRKRWIGLGTVADLIIVWARDTRDGQVGAFVVERGSPGYQAQVIEGKASLRSVWQAETTLDDVRVPASNRLPGARSFADATRVLAATRSTCAWAALGHATTAYDTALRYAGRRPPAHPTVAGLAKMHNTSKARRLVADARDMLGGNGILLDHHIIRHMADLEAIPTFEGTETIQTLIVGRDLTPASAPSCNPFIAVGLGAYQCRVVGRHGHSIGRVQTCSAQRLCRPGGQASGPPRLEPTFEVGRPAKPNPPQARGGED